MVAGNPTGTAHLVAKCEDKMIEYLIDNELGTFSPDHLHNPDLETDLAYIDYAMDIKIPIDISRACSYPDEQTVRAILRPCN